MAAALARAALGWSPMLRRARMGLGARLIRLTLLPLALVLLGALRARSTASTTPSAASPSGFSGGTVRSTIHIVVTLLLCVTWTFSTRTVFRRKVLPGTPNVQARGKPSRDLFRLQLLALL
jgi:hypothetical protein